MAEAPPGTVQCDDTSTCTAVVGPGSECIEVTGLCSNPFVSGCLRTTLGQGIENPSINDEDGNAQQTKTVPDQKSTLRICNSQDDQETIDNNLCIPSPLDYMEIRILTGNWESSLLTAWAMQIVLSEFMEIPTSIESSSPDRKANFYHPTNQFQYGAAAYDFEALEVAYEVGDCRDRIGNLEEGVETEDNDKYTSCAHVMPEVWNGQSAKLWNLTKQRIIEAPEGNGVVGKLTWYIPKFVAEKNPEFAHYAGWSANRTAVATQFLTPMTWSEYCNVKSSSQCEQPDEYATRPPSSEAEEGAYYMYSDGEGFRGHFYASVDNQCLNETKGHECHGHFADFPCDWSTFAVPQAYHLGIPVLSKGSNGLNGGYTYTEKMEIWRAANETQQYVAMNWYTPDPVYQWYGGTEAEFHEVQLTPPTPECVKARVAEDQRCSENLADRVGPPEGACGDEHQTLEKVVVESLYRTIYRYNTQEDPSSGIDMEHADYATRSPAYEAVKVFHLSEFDIGKMFADWRDRLRARGYEGFSTFDGSNGADPRHVVCQWVADNTEQLQAFVPYTHPRILQDDTPDSTVASSVAMAFGVIVSLCVLGMADLTRHLREKEAFQIAQIHFLYLVLCGLLLISTGGIVYAMAPGNVTCVLRNWLICMGYTLEMVPLLVKIGAISTMMRAAKKMRRVIIPRRRLFFEVGGIFLLVVLYLTVWTVVDAPTKGRQLTLQLDGESDSSRAWWQVPATPISVSYYCKAGSDTWFTISFAWQLMLLLSAAIIAMQTRGIQRRWNESRSLAIMIYTQGGFVMLRFLIWLLGESSGVSVQLLDVFQSFLFSLDALLALSIYFGPKLINVYNEMEKAEENSTGSIFSHGASSAAGSSVRPSFPGENRCHVRPSFPGENRCQKCKYLSDIVSRPSLLTANTASEFRSAIGCPPTKTDSQPYQFESNVLMGPASTAGDIIISNATWRSVRERISDISFDERCLISSRDDFGLSNRFKTMQEDTLSQISEDLDAISEHSPLEAAALVRTGEDIDVADSESMTKLEGGGDGGTLPSHGACLCKP